MHILAYCYHWDAKSLWEMRRSERKVWARTVMAQKEAENNAVSKGTKAPSQSGKGGKSYKESSA